MSKTVTFETPVMYGDHHVQAVRQMLLEIQGVEDVYASSGFHVVDVTYNSDLVGEKDIKKVLEENGYLDEFLIPIEADHATYLDSDRAQSFFRHTEIYEKTRQVVGFSQNIEFSGRPLWHCPGFGVMKEKMED